MYDIMIWSMFILQNDYEKFSWHPSPCIAMIFFLVMRAFKVFLFLLFIIIITPFCGWENWNPERSNNILRLMPLSEGGTRWSTWAKAIGEKTWQHIFRGHPPSLPLEAQSLNEFQEEQKLTSWKNGKGEPGRGSHRSEGSRSEGRPHGWSLESWGRACQNLRQQS